MGQAGSGPLAVFLPSLLSGERVARPDSRQEVAVWLGFQTLFFPVSETK